MKKLLLRVFKLSAFRLSMIIAFAFLIMHFALETRIFKTGFFSRDGFFFRLIGEGGAGLGHRGLDEGHVADGRVATRQPGDQGAGEDADRTDRDVDRPFRSHLGNLPVAFVGPTGAISH